MFLVSRNHGAQIAHESKAKEEDGGETPIRPNASGLQIWRNSQCLRVASEAFRALHYGRDLSCFDWTHGDASSVLSQFLTGFHPDPSPQVLVTNCFIQEALQPPPVRLSGPSTFCHVCAHQTLTVCAVHFGSRLDFSHFGSRLDFSAELQQVSVSLPQPCPGCNKSDAVSMPWQP